MLAEFRELSSYPMSTDLLLCDFTLFYIHFTTEHLWIDSLSKYTSTVATLTDFPCDRIMVVDHGQP